jgi:ABC-type iron transport system FetAB ATPase subunit
LSPVTLHLKRLSNELIQPFDLSIGPGEICCISGQSGSGKSRLLRAIADLEPHSGEVMLDGLEQQQLPAHLWRQRVRLVPAESQWWSERVGDHFPAEFNGEGLETLGLPVEAQEWDVMRLSSGEKQRLGLLRALAFPLQVLLLDEPCANLDPETTLRVEAMLLDRIQTEGWPVLWVAHDAAQMQRVADYRFQIRHEQLVEVTDERD